MELVSGRDVRLRLKKGKKWAPNAGVLTAKSVTIDSKTYQLAKGDGIRVAVVLADPSVDGGKDNFHETQSKVRWWSYMDMDSPMRWTFNWNYSPPLQIVTR